jgi:hypothetical protein
MCNSGYQGIIIREPMDVSSVVIAVRMNQLEILRLFQII